VTTLYDVGGVLGRPLGSFLLGSHKSMVTARGSCVNWPSVGLVLCVKWVGCDAFLVQTLN
jgi:hypothetical protein